MLAATMFAWLKTSSKRSRQGLRAAAGVLLVASLIGGGAAVWNSYMKEFFIPKRLAEVGDGLWRSGQISSGLVREVLESKKIGLIIDLTYPDMSDPNQFAEQEVVRDLKIKHLRFPMNGSGEGDINYYADALQALALAEREQVPALVHCAAGARRSAGIVASYQVLVQQIPPEEAYRELDRYGSRPVAESPLVDFLNNNMEELAMLLTERDVIDAVPDPLPLFVPPD